MKVLAGSGIQIRKFLRFSEQARAGGGHWRVGQSSSPLLAIKGMPEGVRPRVRELANRMLIQHHSAVELINRLEARRIRTAGTGGGRPPRGVAGAYRRRAKRVLSELALHHHDELRSAGPRLVAALRRLMPRQNGAQKHPATNKS